MVEVRRRGGGRQPARSPVPLARTPRSLAVAVVGILLMASCGGGEGGDQEAFCAELADGTILVGDGLPVRDVLDELARLAPGDIRGAVEKLASTARDLDDIPDDDLAALFRAAFDPEAGLARADLVDYAEETCQIDVEALAAGRLAADSVIVDELEDFIGGRFSDAAWAAKVRFEPTRDGDELTGMRVRFERRPSSNEPRAACLAVAIFIYDLKGADGSVEVIDATGAVVARQVGPEGECGDT